MILSRSRSKKIMRKHTKWKRIYTNYWHWVQRWWKEHFFSFNRCVRWARVVNCSELSWALILLYMFVIPLLIHSNGMNVWNVNLHSISRHTHIHTQPSNGRQNLYSVENEVFQESLSGCFTYHMHLFSLVVVLLFFIVCMHLRSS